MTLSVLRTLYEVFDQDREKVLRAISSLENDYVALDEIEGDEYFWFGNHFYSCENYVIDYYGNLLDRDEAFWCNGFDEYFSEDDSVTVYEYRDENRYSLRYAEQNSDWSGYRGEFYDQEALEYHDLVYVDDLDEIWSNNDAYYHEGEGNWYSYPDDSEEYTRGYHNGS